MPNMTVSSYQRQRVGEETVMIDNWQQLIIESAKKKASDVFWKAETVPHVRLQGVVQQPDGWPVLTAEDTEQLARSLMTEEDWPRFQEYPEKDIGLTVGDVCRLRINVYREQGAVALSMRIIPLEVPTIDELGLPGSLKDIAMKPHGLVLVTGPTGCGKSTTLATMLEHINTSRRAHIVTVEDPIEYIYHENNCIISQRAVGLDTEGFQDALKYVMRQSPDVILIGEMRDIETFNVAMQAAETGHLVFSTVHTTSAAETMERIIHMFPPVERAPICMRLSRSLSAVISQCLVPRKGQPGRVAAMEIMIVTPTIQQFIQDGQPSEVEDAIYEGAHWGMQTMNQALLEFYKQGIISAEHALFYAGNYTEMRQMLRRLEKEKEDASQAAQQQARKR